MTWKVVRANRPFWLSVALLSLTNMLFAQADPWSYSTGVLKTAFTGTIATSLIAVAVVITGLTFALSDGGKRMFPGLLFGGSMALGAARFIAWIFG